MPENVETLKCPNGHEVEVHWQTGQKAKHWQCPACLVEQDGEDSLVPFHGGK